MLRSLFAATAVALALLSAGAAAAADPTPSSMPLTANGSTYNEFVYYDGTRYWLSHLNYGWGGSAPKVMTVDPTTGYLGVNVFNTPAVTFASPQHVIIDSGGGSGSNAAASATGSAVPASAGYTGFNVSGNLVGVSAANPLPITGSISATNPSVSATASAVPASATYLGASVAGTLTGLVATANGLKVDGSAVTQPVSLSGVATAANQATEITSLSTIATNSGQPLATQSGGNIIGGVVTAAGSVVAATGNVADNATDSGNPIKIGCIYVTTLTTYTTTGNRTNCEADHFGNIRVVSGIFKVGGTDNISNFNMGAFPVAGSVDAVTQANPGVMNLGYNGATSNDWSMQRTMLATDDDTGVGVSAVHTKPISGAAAGLSDSHCTVACASSIVTGAHNLYGAGWSSTVAGWLLVYDATSCSANGTVTPLRAYAYPVANVTATLSWGDLPHHFATGIAACFSTTGPFVATASTTAGIWLDYK